MRLADIFQRNSQAADAAEAARMQGNTSRSGLVNRQIQALIPGQTIQGEIVSRNGSEIQLRLADDMLLNARLDQNMNLEIGKSLAFQVKNNGQSLLLSPLFTNTAVEGNVLKALDMASLPVNSETVEMAGHMMKAGLSVDRNSLQQVFREMNLYPDAESRDIVDLHKLGLPVNESSVNQIASYKNFTHQLLQGMNDLMLALSDTLENMQQGGDIRGAAQLYQQILELVSEEPLYGDIPAVNVEGENQETGGITPDPGQSIGGGPDDASGEVSGLLKTGPGKPDAGGDIPKETVVIREQTGASPADAVIKEPLLRTGDSEVSRTGDSQAFRAGNGEASGTDAMENSRAGVGVVRETFSEAEGEIREGDGRGAVTEPMESSPLSRLFQQTLTADGLAGNKEQLALIRELFDGGLASGDKGLLKELLGSKEVRNVLAERLETLCTAAPEEIEDPKSVDALYQRLDRQLKGLGKALESAGQADSGAYKLVQNLNQNLDFLQQINQVYTYVQLPIRLQQGNAHGDLYVYTNKKNLAAKEGQISALLHLDMEHLGPVDVYVLMQSEKVSTRFYVQDDEMLDFLEEHMDILTERLKRRGYDMTVQMQIREDNPRSNDMGAMAGLVPEEDQTGAGMLQQYAFDVRA